MSLDGFGFVCRIVGRTHHWEASQVLVLLKQTDTEGRQTPEVGWEVSGIGVRLVMILCEDFMLSKIFQLLADRRPALWDVVVTFGDSVGPISHSSMPSSRGHGLCQHHG